LYVCMLLYNHMCCIVCPERILKTRKLDLMVFCQAVSKHVGTGLLQVYKRENFKDSDFEFSTFS
jgi:hypothetical protein